eukprot:TRINITY_DN43_c0_g1_i21.p3 TRINITY_DN43_c0_g1~~TRINITY_DN43_c0_g1_i21.p3  ORF type:complete len:111 (+),score=21.06 TRINITY_DN43_c0_g1_i21:143-475(+)
MIRRPPRSTQSRSSAASDVYKRQVSTQSTGDQANKRIWWMPWRQQAMKDVVACDKSRGAGKQALIREFPNGETHPACWVLCTEYIGVWSEPGELKHLSTRRKRNQPRFRK